MPKRDLRLYLHDIKDSAEAIKLFTFDMDLETFKNDRKTYSATIREFEIIGEAVKNLPDSLLCKYDEVSWRDIRDFRNLLIHEYFGVDFEIVWNTIKVDLPILDIVVKKMLKELYGE
ncbi:MAG: DUF86 domain-containing protein [Epsilonproteobacteria bacterium]|nr:DUF86 domain-containing protein [Campylobacterota bacterium]